MCIRDTLVIHKWGFLRCVNVTINAATVHLKDTVTLVLT